MQSPSHSPRIYVSAVLCATACTHVSLGMTKHTGRGFARSQIRTGQGNCVRACVCVCVYMCLQINIEGTGSLGILANVLLDQINALSNLTPRLGARARADSAIVGGSVVGGTNTASRRNTTVVLQASGVVQKARVACSCASSSSMHAHGLLLVYWCMEC